LVLAEGAGPGGELVSHRTALTVRITSAATQTPAAIPIPHLLCLAVRSCTSASRPDTGDGAGSGAVCGAATSGAVVVSTFPGAVHVLGADGRAGALLGAIAGHAPEAIAGEALSATPCEVGGGGIWSGVSLTVCLGPSLEAGGDASEAGALAGDDGIQSGGSRS